MATKQKVHVLQVLTCQRKHFLAGMAGLTAGQPGMVSTMAVLLKAQKQVHTMQNAMQHVHQDDIGCICYLLSVFAKGQLIHISKDINERYWFSVYAK